MALPASPVAHYAALTESLVNLLDEHGALLQDLAVEFYAKDIWGRVEADWRRFLDTRARHELPAMLTAHAAPLPDGCPESLRAFLDACKACSLTRVVDAALFARLEPPALSAAFEAGIKAKKIERLAALVAAVMRSVDAVVDVGGGKGHLAHVLQHYYAMHVVNLEGHAAHTQRARLRSGDLRQRLWMARQRELKRRGLPHLSKREYVHEEPESRCFEYFLSPDVDAAHFEDELAVFLHGSQSAPILVNFGLLTLHGCGDLTPSVVRLFTACTAAQALVCVGCCYHKVDLMRKPLLSFPMSERVRSLLAKCKSNAWQPGLLQTATESPRSFLHMSEKELIVRERKLAFRAIFEVALRESLKERSIEASEYSMGRLRPKTVFDNIGEFGKAALNKVCTHNGNQVVFLRESFDEASWTTVCESTLRKMYELYENHQDRFSRLTAYLSLVNALADPCESLVVLDRFWFLHETQNSSVHIMPVFDADCSPRNFALVAVKHSEKLV